MRTASTQVESLPRGCPQGRQLEAVARAPLRSAPCSSRRSGYCRPRMPSAHRHRGQAAGCAHRWAAPSGSTSPREPHRSHASRGAAGRAASCGTAPSAAPCHLLCRHAWTGASLGTRCHRKCTPACCAARSQPRALRPPTRCAPPRPRHRHCRCRRRRQPRLGQRQCRPGAAAGSSVWRRVPPAPAGAAQGLPEALAHERLPQPSPASSDAAHFAAWPGRRRPPCASSPPSTGTVRTH